MTYAPKGYAPPVQPPTGAPPRAPLAGSRPVSLMGAGGAAVGMDRLPRIPLGEHTFELVSIECKTRRKDTNYIAALKFVDTNRQDLLDSHRVTPGQTVCVFYQSMHNQDVAFGQIKGFMMALLGIDRNDPQFHPQSGDRDAIEWLDQNINEAAFEGPDGKGLCTVNGEWENWGTAVARVAKPGQSLVGTKFKCIARPGKEKPADKRDVFGDEYYCKYVFSPA